MQNRSNGAPSTWWNTRQDIGTLFEDVFQRHAQEKNIPISYQTERARNAMLQDLRKFAADDDWPRAKAQLHECILHRPARPIDTGPLFCLDGPGKQRDVGASTKVLALTGDPISGALLADTSK